MKAPLFALALLAASAPVASVQGDETLCERLAKLRTGARRSRALCAALPADLHMVVSEACAALDSGVEQVRSRPTAALLAELGVGVFAAGGRANPSFPVGRVGVRLAAPPVGGDPWRAIVVATRIALAQHRTVLVAERSRALVEVVRKQTEALSTLRGSVRLTTPGVRSSSETTVHGEASPASASETAAQRVEELAQDFYTYIACLTPAHDKKVCDGLWEKAAKTKGPKPKIDSPPGAGLTELSITAEASTPSNESVAQFTLTASGGDRLVTRSLEDVESRIADVECAIAALEGAEQDDAAELSSGARAKVEGSRVDLTVGVEPLRPVRSCESSPCDFSEQPVLHPLVELRSDRVLARFGDLALGLAGSAGFVGGAFVNEHSGGDRLRLGVSSMLRLGTRDGGSLAALGGELEIGLRRAKYLDEESPGASSARLHATCALEHGRLGNASFRPILVLWTDRPLGSGRSRDGGALLVRAVLR